MCTYCQDNNVFGKGERINNNTTEHEHFIKYKKNKYYFFTTINGVDTYSCPLKYCPFCGEELKVREGDFDNIFDYLKSIKDDPEKFEETISLAATYQSNNMDPSVCMENIIKDVDYKLNPEKYETTPEETPVEPEDPVVEPETETEPEKGDDDPTCGKIEDLLNGEESTEKK
jgi:hypothetical protein